MQKADLGLRFSSGPQDSLLTLVGPVRFGQV